MPAKITQLLSIQDPQAIPMAAEIIAQGGLIVFPTDTIYGIAANPWCAPAIRDIYLAKQRPIEKAIPLLIGSFDQLNLITDRLNQRMLNLASAFWPGSLTLILPKKPGLPDEISQYPTLGVRMPDHPFTLALLQCIGPLATTSANISGSLNPLNAQDVLSQLNGLVDLILDGGQTPGDRASTVVDCTRDELVILRQGPISLEALQEHWNATS